VKRLFVCNGWSRLGLAYYRPGLIAGTGLGVAYDRTAASLHSSDVTASTISVSAHHWPVWNGLRPAEDMVTGDSHGL